MTEQSDRIVKKLWNYCQVLRGDGLSYQDYLEPALEQIESVLGDLRARASVVARD